MGEIQRRIAYGRYDTTKLAIKQQKNSRLVVLHQLLE